MDIEFSRRMRSDTRDTSSGKVINNWDVSPWNTIGYTLSNKRTTCLFRCCVNHYRAWKLHTSQDFQEKNIEFRSYNPLKCCQIILASVQVHTLCEQFWLRIQTFLTSRSKTLFNPYATQSFRNTHSWKMDLCLEMKNPKRDAFGFRFLSWPRQDSNLWPSA